MFFIVFYAGHKIYGLYKTYVQPMISVYKTFNPGDSPNEDVGRNGAQAPEENENENVEVMSDFEEESSLDEDE